VADLSTTISTGFDELRQARERLYCPFVGVEHLNSLLQF